MYENQRAGVSNLGVVSTKGSLHSIVSSLFYQRLRGRDGYTKRGYKDVYNRYEKNTDDDVIIDPPGEQRLRLPFYVEATFENEAGAHGDLV